MWKISQNWYRLKIKLIIVKLKSNSYINRTAIQIDTNYCSRKEKGPTQTTKTPPRWNTATYRRLPGSFWSDCAKSKWFYLRYICFILCFIFARQVESKGEKKGIWGMVFGSWEVNKCFTVTNTAGIFCETRAGLFSFVLIETGECIQTIGSPQYKSGLNVWPFHKEI